MELLLLALFLIHSLLHTPRVLLLLPLNRVITHHVPSNMHARSVLPGLLIMHECSVWPLFPCHCLCGHLMTLNQLLMIDTQRPSKEKTETLGEREAGKR